MPSRVMWPARFLISLVVIIMVLVHVGRVTQVDVWHEPQRKGSVPLSSWIATVTHRRARDDVQVVRTSSLEPSLCFAVPAPPSHAGEKRVSQGRVFIGA